MRWTPSTDPNRNDPRRPLLVGGLLVVAAVLLFVAVDERSGAAYDGSNQVPVRQPNEARDRAPESHPGAASPEIQSASKPERKEHPRARAPRNDSDPNALERLTGRDYESARNTIVRMIKSRQRRFDDYVRQNREPSTATSLREAELFFSLQKSRSLLAAFEGGSYTVGQGNHGPDPDDRITFHMGIVKDGKPAQLSVVILNKDHPDVVAAGRNVESMRANLLLEHANRFNSKPMPTRESMIRKHDAIRRKPSSQRSSSDRGYLKAYFPRGLRIERVNSKLVVDKN